MDVFAVHAEHVGANVKARGDLDRGRRNLGRSASDDRRFCLQFAREWFGPETVAPAIASLIAADNHYVASEPSGLSWPTPGGHDASAGYAWLTGASWGTATVSQYRAWLRHKTYVHGSVRLERADERVEAFTFSKAL